MEKKFNHNEIEVCNLCKKPINTLKEEWATIIEYIEEHQTSIKFYHKICLVNFMKGNVKIIRDNFENKLKNFTGKILNSLNGRQQIEGRDFSNL
jgi:hypothetical protein